MNAHTNLDKCGCDAGRMAAVTDFLNEPWPENSKGETVEEWLVSVLISDPHLVVRHEAAFVLGELYARKRIPGGVALKALCDVSKSDTSVVVRHEAAESLGNFDDPLACQTLNELMFDPNEEVVATARLSVERLASFSSGRLES